MENPEMTGVCKECKLWKEEKYWNELPPNKHHFFKIMLGDFANHMRIPKKFMKNFKGEILETVTLRGPSEKTWTMKLSKIEDNFILENGWEIFAKDHNLNCGDFLVFRYVNNSTFHVLVFDPSCCEREECFFVENINSNLINYNRAPNGCCCSNKKSSEQGCMEEDHVKSESSKHGKGSDQYQESDSEDEELMFCEKHSNKEFSGASSGTVNMDDEVPRRYPMYYISKRRAITLTDKQRAYDLASRHTTKRPSCKIRMKPSHVYHGFILTIPIEWADTYLPSKSQEIQLRVPPGRKRWNVQFKQRAQQSTLNKGWAKFVLENTLEEHDYCVLELAHNKAINGKKMTLLDVFIYRAVEKTIPLEVYKRPTPKC